MKKNDTIFLSFIIIVLAIFCILLLTGKINFNKDNNIDIDYSKLSEYGKSDYNYINSVYNGDYSFKLLIDGRININFENYISNISNAKDFILFSPPSPDSTLYILTSNGDIYKYETSDYKSNNYSATKVDKYSNIKQIITYQTRKQNAGGCDYLIAIDKSNKYYEINSFCV